MDGFTHQGGIDPHISFRNSCPLDLTQKSWGPSLLREKTIKQETETSQLVIVNGCGKTQLQTRLDIGAAESDESPSSAIDRRQNDIDNDPIPECKVSVSRFDLGLWN